MTGFSYKEIDEEGLETLNVIGKADKFNMWMFHTIKPFCYGEILEVGCGIGNISKFFLDCGFSMTLSDIRENYCKSVKARFNGLRGLKGVNRLDIADPLFHSKHQELKHRFDTVFALNIIEHVEHQEQAIENCRFLLKHGGTLIILVPAWQALYNNFDRELFHYRRYTRKNLNLRIRNKGFKIKKSFYFNAAGIPGWFLFGSLLGKKIIPEGQMNSFNKMVPFFRLIDRLFFRRIGLSVITVAVSNDE